MGMGQNLPPFSEYTFDGVEREPSVVTAREPSAKWYLDF